VQQGKDLMQKENGKKKVARRESRKGGEGGGETGEAICSITTEKDMKKKAWKEIFISALGGGKEK